MPRRKAGAATEARPALLQTGAAPLTFAALRALADYTYSRVQYAVDLRDNSHDRLFGAVMAWVDALQMEREAYLQVLARLQRTPEAWPAALQVGGGIARRLLKASGLAVEDRRRRLQVAGLLAVMAATLQVWRNDTGADLPATLRACDTALRRSAAVGAWLGFV